MSNSVVPAGIEENVIEIDQNAHTEISTEPFVFVENTEIGHEEWIPKSLWVRNPTKFKYIYEAMHGMTFIRLGWFDGIEECISCWNGPHRSVEDAIEEFQIFLEAL